jgi:hypothetical protein
MFKNIGGKQPTTQVFSNIPGLNLRPFSAVKVLSFVHCLLTAMTTLHNCPGRCRICYTKHPAFLPYRDPSSQTHRSGPLGRLAYRVLNVTSSAFATHYTLRRVRKHNSSQRSSHITLDTISTNPVLHGGFISSALSQDSGVPCLKAGQKQKQEQKQGNCLSLLGCRRVAAPQTRKWAYESPRIPSRSSHCIPGRTFNSSLLYTFAARLFGTVLHG